jgi:hypothetical protein
MNTDMKKETAVDYMFRLLDVLTFGKDNETQNIFNDILQQAKEMERREAEENFIQGWYECIERTKETKFELDHKDVEFFAYAHAVHEYGGEL